MKVLKKLYALLNKTQRLNAITLLLLMLVGMILETLSIGLVVPTLGLMTTSDLALRYPSITPLLEMLNHPTQQQLVIGGMCGLVIIYFIKAGFLTFLAWKQSKFVYGVQAYMSQRLYAGYLRQPYIFHLQHNSAQLIRNTANETNQLTTALLAIMTLLTELQVLIGICALLIYVEPLGSLTVILTLGISTVLFYRFTSSHILRWGKARQLHEGLRIQHLQQGLGGAKDVKLLGRESDFLEQFSKHNLSSSKVGQHQNFLQQLPRLILEVISMLGLSILTFVMLNQGKPVEAMFPTLGLFAASAFRFLPSANRVINSIQSIRYNQPVVHTLYNEVNSFSENSEDTSSSSDNLVFSKNLVFDNVSFIYPNVEERTLKSVTLSIKKGSCIGFIGGSGAGKSTLVDVLLGLLKPAIGKILVDGIDIQSNMRGWQNQIGYVPQNIYLTDDTLRRNIAFGLSEDQIEDTKIRAAIIAAQLDSFIDSLPDGLNTVVGERGVRLSGGQRQRIGIARAMYHDPAVLVLDEATSSLDIGTEEGVMNAIKQFLGEKTIIIVAHRLSTVSQCNWLFRIEKGELLEEGEANLLIDKFMKSKVDLGLEVGVTE